jgi:signal transduction histidine kinase/CheY-like chemotaxis protein
MGRPSFWQRLEVRWRAAGIAGDAQMAQNRFITGLLVLAFNLYAVPRGLLGGWPMTAVGLYLALDVVVFAHLLLFPRAKITRRVAALVLDVTAISYELHVGSDATAWLTPGYLWVVAGNGFRFGPGLLLAAVLLSIIGFGAVAASTPIWIAHPSLVMGTVLGLAVPPLYALVLFRKLLQARRQAEAASEAKSMFLASVSHELRTPLNAIIGMGALLETSPLDPDQAEMSQTIMTAARSLLSLIDGILDLSRIEAGRMPVSRQDFDLARLLSEVRAIFLAQGRSKSVPLCLHVTPRTPLLLHGDVRRLHEILLNLVGNALKFTDTGNVVISVDAVRQADGRVRLRFEVEDTGIGIAPEAQERIFETFTQADHSIVGRYGGTGLGLAITSKLVHLLDGEIGVQSTPGVGSTFWFELDCGCRPFSAEDRPSFADLRGFVCASQAAVAAAMLGRLGALGARIEAVEPGTAGANGFTEAGPGGPGDFILAFDRSSANAPAAPFDALEASEGLAFVAFREQGSAGLPPMAERQVCLTSLAASPSGAELAFLHHLLAAARAGTSDRAGATATRVTRPSLRVLVADDNAINRRVVTRILTSAGHMVTAVADGEQALDALEDAPFDVALLDVNMPVLDGIEAAKLYRFASLSERPVPLIALTADATARTRDRCLEAGMDTCLVKPVEPERLLDVIEETVRAAGGGAEDAVAPPGLARVTEIASHPRYRSAPPSPLDAKILANLHALGGEAFVAEIAGGFCKEARAKLAELRAAVAATDVEGSRAQAHALCSMATNIGARPLSDLCRSFESITADTLRSRGARYLAQITAELGRVEAALDERGAGEAALAER